MPHSKHAKTRKKRNDRNHLIYMLTCEVTNERYIGVTVSKPGGKWKTLRQRWQSHAYKAFTLQEDWELSYAIRKYGEESFTIEILDVVRGKKDAFAREALLINHMETELNTRKKQSI